MPPSLQKKDDAEIKLVRLMFRHSERLASRWEHVWGKNKSLQEELEKVWGQSDILKERLEKFRKLVRDSEKELNLIEAIMKSPRNEPAP